MPIQRELFNKGKEALEKTDFPNAEKFFLQSVRREPGSQAADYLLFVYLIRSDYRKLSSAIGERKITSGFGFYPLYWFQFMAGELDAADQTLERMLQSSHYFLRAFAVKELLMRGKLTDIDGAVNGMIRSTGLSYEFSMEEQRAALFYEMLRGNPRDAVVLSKKLVEKYPLLPDAVLDHIDVLSRAEDPALMDFLRSEQVVKMAENDHRIMLSAAKAFYKKDETEPARSYLKRLVSYFRNNPLFHYHMANLWLKQKQYVRAIQEYEEAVALAPFFERAYYNMGACYYRLGEIIQSGSCFKKALSIRKKSDSIINYSICMIEKKDLKEAYFFLNRVQQESSSRPLEPIKDQIKQLAVFS